MDEQKYKSLIWQGDIRKVISYLEELGDSDIQAHAMKEKLVKRFITQEEQYGIDTTDDWVKAVITCYIEYFNKVLTGSDKVKEEEELFGTLKSFLSDKDYKDLNVLEEKLTELFKEKGYSFMGGVTRPYRGPYIWRTTEELNFKVNLPYSIEDVKVFMLSDFLLISWADYASFGKSHTGGWCLEDGLYYVQKRNQPTDTNSMKFQVWFLKHEAQHLSDYKNYPNLDSVNLEYRAKLIELMYNTDSIELIDKFISDSKKDESLPHPYASYTIIKNLSNLLFNTEWQGSVEEWKIKGVESIQIGAKCLYDESEKALKALGRNTTGVKY